MSVQFQAETSIRDNGSALQHTSVCIGDSDVSVNGATIIQDGRLIDPTPVSSGKGKGGPGDTSAIQDSTLHAIARVVLGILSAGLGQAIATRIGWSAAVLPLTAGGAVAFGALYAVTHAVFFALFPSALDNKMARWIPFVLTGMGALYLLQWSLPALCITLTAGIFITTSLSVLFELVALACAWSMVAQDGGA